MPAEKELQKLGASGSASGFSLLFQIWKRWYCLRIYKLDQYDLRKETLKLNGKELVRFDYFNQSETERFVDSTLKGSLNIDLPDNKLSVLKYIYRNTPTNSSSPERNWSIFVKTCCGIAVCPKEILTWALQQEILNWQKWFVEIISWRSFNTS